MPVDIQISDEGIAYTERVLLPREKHFDQERRDFIKCFDTVDLQAVPGSGKTTALLAKLLSLEKRLPLPDGTGILVISHTNAAVNEIQSRIGKLCPRLFSYPNYVGTIQSFVDTYIAIPSFVQVMGFRPSRIDADIYDQEVSNYYDHLPPKGSVMAWLGRKSEPEKYLRNLRFDQDLNLTEGIYGKVALNSKSQSPTYKTLMGMKWRLFDRGILHFEDVYLFAQALLEKNNLAITLLRKRFRYIFVDEMQDMAGHQHDLLEALYAPDNSPDTVFQRIGDTDQAIFGSINIAEKSGWQYREKVMSLNNSLRLSPTVSGILAPFAFERGADFQVNGLGDAEIKPHVIVYDDNTVTKVVERYAQLISTLRKTGEIPKVFQAPYKAVAWNSTWGEESESDTQKLRLIDFCPGFQRAASKKQEEFDTLADYLACVDLDDRTLSSARKAILRGVVRALRYEGVVDPRNERPFTVVSLASYFRFELPHIYRRYNLYLYRWTVDLVKKNTERPIKHLRRLIPKLILHFDKTFSTSKKFISADPQGGSLALANGVNDPNTLIFDDIEINLGTVHSVKGQTHTATLYIESSYQKDGVGANAKRYESQRLADQFKGKRLPSNAGKRVKESARMVYVGFSRPTHLLAFAVHKDRFDAYLSVIDTGVWEIVKLHEERTSS